jgi:DNA polymerase
MHHAAIMGAYQAIDTADYASALDWWRDAGVDTLVDDEVRYWLAAPPPPALRAVEAAPDQAPAGALPDTIEAFAAWRLGADAPEAGWSGVSLAATGPADARVMILVDCPDREDGDAGALLSGASGRLLDRMLAAIGLSRETVHVAAVCARRPSAGRMAREIEARLGEVARHHVALIAPERLLLLGDATSRAVLSAERDKVRGRLQDFDHKMGRTGVVASLHPRLLLERPALKAESWRDLRLLVSGMDERKA